VTKIAPPETWLKAMIVMRDHLADWAAAVARGDARPGMTPGDRAAYVAELEERIAEATATIDQAIADRDAGRPYGPKRRP
jgi:hypothetical protein